MKDLKSLSQKTFVRQDITRQTQNTLEFDSGLMRSTYSPPPMISWASWSLSTSTTRETWTFSFSVSSSVFVKARLNVFGLRKTIWRFFSKKNFAYKPKDLGHAYSALEITFLGRTCRREMSKPLGLSDPSVFNEGDDWFSTGPGDHSNGVELHHCMKERWHALSVGNSVSKKMPNCQWDCLSLRCSVGGSCQWNNELSYILLFYLLVNHKTIICSSPRNNSIFGAS